jgi:hypothetical protein
VLSVDNDLVDKTGVDVMITSVDKHHFWLISQVLPFLVDQSISLSTSIPNTHTGEKRKRKEKPPGGAQML